MTKYEPTLEQNKFINNNSKFLIVSAGPGSGKTATIIEYLKNIIENDSKKQIIVSSFTNNSTNEIKNRFFQKYNNKGDGKIIFQTFDSFLITKIWKFYFNRIIEFANKTFDLDFDNNFRLVPKDIIYHKIKWSDFEKNNTHKNWMKEKVEEFINYGKKEKFLNGFVSDHVLLLFLKSNKEICEYLSTNFKKIIIDEAQDLSLLRHDILLYFHNKCGIEIVLVGDERQTLYTWLGAKKDIFKSLKKNNKNIEQIYLDKNFRYSIKEESNYDLSNLIESNDEISFKRELETCIQNNKIETITYNQIREKIDNNNNNNLFLTKTNADVEKISKKLSSIKIKNIPILPVPKELELSPQQQIFITNIFIYNEIKLGNIKYSLHCSDLVNEICDFIWPFNPNKNKLFLKLFWKNENFKLEELIKEIDKLTKINNLNEVIEFFKKNKYYLKNIPTLENKVMTYYGAKGLEGYNIFINESNIKSFLKNGYNSPTYNEIYVAISRVKNKIYFIKDENSNNYNNKYQNIFL